MKHSYSTLNIGADLNSIHVGDFVKASTLVFESSTGSNGCFQAHSHCVLVDLQY